MRTRITRDANHIEIQRGLEALGVFVSDMAAVGGSFPDLITWNGRTCVLIEIKMPGANIFIDQLSYLATNPGYTGFARDFDEARNLVQWPERYCLSPSEKQRILSICHHYRSKSKDKRPRISVSKFEKEMRG